MHFWDFGLGFSILIGICATGISEKIFGLEGHFFFGVFFE
jgi:hypothetical protein